MSKLNDHFKLTCAEYKFNTMVRVAVNASPETIVEGLTTIGVELNQRLEKEKIKYAKKEVFEIFEEMCSDSVLDEIDLDAKNLEQVVLRTGIASAILHGFTKD